MPDTPNPARPVFPQQARAQVAAADPETLFGELPRRRDGVGALWSHQVDQLRTYSGNHLDTADVALELPTGSGKTLVGLLIGEWRRRSRRERVVYACPPDSSRFRSWPLASGKASACTPSSTHTTTGIRAR